MSKILQWTGALALLSILIFGIVNAGGKYDSALDSLLVDKIGEFTAGSGVTFTSNTNFSNNPQLDNITELTSGGIGLTLINGTNYPYFNVQTEQMTLSRAGGIDENVRIVLNVSGVTLNSGISWANNSGGTLDYEASIFYSMNGSALNPNMITFYNEDSQIYVFMVNMTNGDINATGRVKIGDGSKQEKGTLKSNATGLYVYNGTLWSVINTY